jgi:hypothetical protein
MYSPSDKSKLLAPHNLRVSTSYTPYFPPLFREGGVRKWGEPVLMILEIMGTFFLSGVEMSLNWIPDKIRKI